VKTALLDVNVLTALHWPNHQHHASAHRWAAGRLHAKWATSPLTQLGFLRTISNPAITPDALSPTEALALLDVSRGQATHEFWPDDADVRDALKDLPTPLQGYKQLNDAYLLALAGRRHGVVATFDRGLRTLAGLRSTLVEVVPA
jgi:toxin-antitoxin system PIN domain toxin